MCFSGCLRRRWLKETSKSNSLTSKRPCVYVVLPACRGESRPATVRRCSTAEGKQQSCRRPTWDTGRILGSLCGCEVSSTVTTLQEERKEGGWMEGKLKWTSCPPGWSIHPTESFVNNCEMWLYNDELTGCDQAVQDSYIWRKSQTNKVFCSSYCLQHLSSSDGKERTSRNIRRPNTKVNRGLKDVVIRTWIVICLPLFNLCRLRFICQRKWSKIMLIYSFSNRLADPKCCQLSEYVHSLLAIATYCWDRYLHTSCVYCIRYLVGYIHIQYLPSLLDVQVHYMPFYG